MGDDQGTRPSRSKRVVKTGLAIVHRHEVVLPAAGSEAEAEQAGDDARSRLEYYFPVEIEVRGAGKGVDEDAIADRVLRRLAERLDKESD